MRGGNRGKDRQYSATVGWNQRRSARNQPRRARSKEGWRNPVMDEQLKKKRNRGGWEIKSATCWVWAIGDQTIRVENQLIIW